MERNRELINELTAHATWDNFVFACSKRIDVTGRWRPTIARAVDTTPYMMQYDERSGKVPALWMAKVAELPAWTPPKERRSNFSQIAGELVRRLRHSGMSRHEIAKAFNDLLRDFNGTHVTTADITASLD